MKFSEMQYRHVNMDECAERAGKITTDLKNAETFEEADKAFLEFDRMSAQIQTFNQLAYVRNSIDTGDEFYKKEKEYTDNIGPQLHELEQKFQLAVFNSKFRQQFAEKYGEIYFKNIENYLKAFSPAIIEDMQKENRLISEYQALCASAQIFFDGKTLTVPQMSPYLQSTDDTQRKEAWNALGNWYNSVGDKLDSIFDQLVRLRDGMAKKMGYKDFIELGYYRMNRNCYDRNDVEKFRKAVVTHIVPVVCKIKKQQAERIGVNYPMTISDNALTFRSGNPVPRVTSEELLSHAKKFYHELSPETAEFIDVMYDNELMDVMSKKGKANGGYCTNFYDYEVPFIFSNFNGTSHDVEVLTHEAGHAFAYYMSRKLKPVSLIWPTMESCEIHSMTMEFFAWPWCEGFFKEDTAKYYYHHLSDALSTICYIVLVDHFQHEMYEQPSLSPSERHEVWKRLEGIYRPWLVYDDTPFYGKGRYWQRQLHIYCHPFYYIDYSLAQTTALEFWSVMQKDKKDAWERYKKLVSCGGTKTFTELVKTAGLEDPFDEATLKTVAEAVQNWLDNFDVSSVK